MKSVELWGNALRKNTRITSQLGDAMTKLRKYYISKASLSVDHSRNPEISLEAQRNINLIQDQYMYIQFIANNKVDA